MDTKELQHLEAGLLGDAYSHLNENTARRDRWKNLTEKVSRYDTNHEIRHQKGMAPEMRRKMEVMFENTVSWINGREGQNAGAGHVDENTLKFLNGELKENAVTTANISTFTTVAFPLIRRVYPNLISNFLVSVQPIPLPTALIFYLDFKYGNSFSPVQRGDNINDRGIVGGQNRFVRARNYAAGRISAEAVGTGDGSNATFYLAWFPIKAASVTIYVNGVAVAVTSIDYETGRTVLAAAPASGAAVTADYALVFEGTGPIPSVELQMSQDTVTSESRKLKAQWSIEAAQDAMVYHGLDIDSELLNVMAEEITREIDATVIDDIITAAGAGAGNVTWSTTVGSGYSPLEWQRTLFDAFIDASNLIHTRRLRYANWILVGDDIINRITKLAGWNANIFPTPGGGVPGTLDQFNTPVVNGQGPAFMGTLNSRFAIFHDPVHVPANKAIVGFRGNTMLDTGYIFAPYQPLFVTPVLLDPNDFTPRRGVMTRYARKLVSPDFYATVTVA